MKFKVFIFIVVVAIWFMGVSFYSMKELPKNYKPIPVYKSEQKEIGKLLPDFSFTTYYDQQINIQDLKERVIIVYFWADGCLTCKVELIKLYKLLYRYQDKIAIVTVSTDDKKQTMWKSMSFLDQKDFDLRHRNIYWAWDKDKIISNKIFGVRKLPEAIFINEDRHMVFKTIGATDWLDSKITNRINEMLK